MCNLRASSLFDKNVDRLNQMIFYLAIEWLRQSDDTGTRVDDEMVRELYAIFHWRSFGIVALQDEYFRPDLGRFREW